MTKPNIHTPRAPNRVMEKQTSDGSDSTRAHEPKEAAQKKHLWICECGRILTADDFIKVRVGTAIGLGWPIVEWKSPCCKRGGSDRRVTYIGCLEGAA